MAVVKIPLITFFGLAVLTGVSFNFVEIREAKAATFTFTSIASNTNDSFSQGFFSNVVVNNEGTVAFVSFPNLSTGNYSIFVSDGTEINTIATARSGYSLAYLSDINDEGIVAFLRTDDLTGATGIFIGNGRTTTTIADESDFSRGFSGNFGINNEGIVVFSASEGNTSGIFTSDGETITTIVDRNDFFRVLGSLDINNAGTIAFSAAVDLGNLPFLDAGFFTYDNGIISTVAQSGNFFESFTDYVDINDNGVVAFRASLGKDVYGIFVYGIFTSDGRIVTDLINTGNDFSYLGEPVINNEGTVAFIAVSSTGDSGIFISSDSVFDKVITTGDFLFGSVVTSVSFSINGLNDNNQIAFLAQLEDGRQFVVRADPSTSTSPSTVPEPSYVLGLFLFSVLGINSVLRRF